MSHFGGAAFGFVADGRRGAGGCFEVFDVVIVGKCGSAVELDALAQIDNLAYGCGAAVGGAGFNQHAGLGCQQTQNAQREHDECRKRFKQGKTALALQRCAGWGLGVWLGCFAFHG